MMRLVGASEKRAQEKKAGFIQRKLSAVRYTSSILSLVPILFSHPEIPQTFWASPSVYCTVVACFSDLSAYCRATEVATPTAARRTDPGESGESTQARAVDSRAPLKPHSPAYTSGSADEGRISEAEQADCQLQLLLPCTVATLLLYLVPNIDVPLYLARNYCCRWFQLPSTLSKSAPQ